jgi:hypothetical protein
MKAYDVAGYVWYAEAAYGLKWHCMMKNDPVSFFNEEDAMTYAKNLLETIKYYETEDKGGIMEEDFEEEDIQVLYIVRGLPGSGKTTIAKRISEISTFVHRSCFHVEADMFFDIDGEYVYEPKLVSAAHAWCQSQTERELYRGNSVVVANTFTTIEEMIPYFLIVKKLMAIGYMIKIIINEADGDFGSVHNVPKEVITKMDERWEDTDAVKLFCKQMIRMPWANQSNKRRNDARI